ncbi:MAG: rod shape-determining protein [Candidatus Taylorbacteria bacterium CG10_big_fil_rev_8_21_14_0_10_41_48]|uniref:Cell shape-determining protein MreB n=1 Tax=Candidatus Taylorbacteria bacterium CG10_big_fil_rev_8_21_14_0_10_41_48 TaxID=1975024 RepID=A0A2M8LC25_9BACT|nr:MAG: rod shape-determining protein [Candidatus Taylorbacteria bacterium CG10_big_fil_rev_8_21_14_0_10_41_48]
MQRLLEKLYKAFSHDIGIDLGTANTLVYMKGQGIVINEPSVVAINQKTGRVVAVGSQAKDMLGRTPGHIQAVRPLVDGVISDFEVAEEMIVYLLNKAQKDTKKFFGPRVIVGIPAGVTNVEARAVRDATKNAGAREVHVVEQPMAAAIGIGLPIHEPAGNMVIDIGGGTTDVAVISLGGVVRSKSLKIAGDRLNSDIISYIRNEFKILVGEKTAEDVKMSIGVVVPDNQPHEAAIRGRDLVTGLPREVVITDADIREAVSQSIDNLIESVKEVLETTPPEILADVMHRGVYLVGGGALIRGLDVLVEEHAKIPVHIADDPLTAVARGTGIILEDLEKYFDVLIESEDDLPKAQ